MGFLDVLDAKLGDSLENALCSHHARRLRRLGWGEVLDGSGAGWFTPRRTVQRGNKIQILVDGAAAFPVVAQAIENAQTYVHIANWHASPDFRLTREPGAPQLRELLTRRRGTGRGAGAAVGRPAGAVRSSRRASGPRRRSASS